MPDTKKNHSHEHDSSKKSSVGNDKSKMGKTSSERSQTVSHKNDNTNMAQPNPTNR